MDCFRSCARDCPVELDKCSSALPTQCQFDIDGPITTPWSASAGPLRRLRHSQSEELHEPLDESAAVPAGPDDFVGETSQQVSGTTRDAVEPLCPLPYAAAPHQWRDPAAYNPKVPSEGGGSIRPPGSLSDITDFKVQICKQGDPAATSMGMGLTCHFGRFAVVQCLKAGVISDYNANCVGTDRIPVEVNDFLATVNGQGGNTEAMLALFKTCNDLTIHLRRVKKYQATVKTEGELGMELDAGTMCVKRMGKGTVHDYNRQCAVGCQVLVNDRIVEINGKEGTPDELWQILNFLLGSADVLSEITLTMVR